MKLEFEEYRPRKIVNVHKHVDGPWFWGKYSAHPYIGCRAGCHFCYARGGRYLGRRDPETFDTVIRVKVNAVELLRKELSRLEREVIAAGDWQQPAESRYRLSRSMLQVVSDLGFPLYINERSPLLVRDIDLLQEISRQSWVGVSFSISNVDRDLKRTFEPHSPGVRKRLQAMDRLAQAGITVGASMMPILPLVGDDESHLDDTIRAIRDHGGSFVMAGGLTMDGVQADRTLAAFRRRDPTLEDRLRGMYQWPAGGKPNYGPPPAYNSRLGLLVRDLCARHGISDRMDRYVAPGPLAVNKRIAEQLFLKTYDLELEQAAGYRIWAYRKAAWTVDEWPENLAAIADTGGEAALRKLPAIGRSMAGQIVRLLREHGQEWAAEWRPAGWGDDGLPPVAPDGIEAS